MTASALGLKMPSFDHGTVGWVLTATGTWEDIVEIEDGIGLTGGDETVGGEDVLVAEKAGWGDTMWGEGACV